MAMHGVDHSQRGSYVDQNVNTSYSGKLQKQDSKEELSIGINSEPNKERICAQVRDAAKDSSIPKAQSQRTSQPKKNPILAFFSKIIDSFKSKSSNAPRARTIPQNYSNTDAYKKQESIKLALPLLKQIYTQQKLENTQLQLLNDLDYSQGYEAVNQFIGTLSLTKDESQTLLRNENFATNLAKLGKNDPQMFGTLCQILHQDPSHMSDLLIKR